MNAASWEPEIRAVPNTGPASELDVEATSVDVLIELNQRRARLGGSILDEAETVESVWGNGHQSLWPKGEPFLICGPDGVGKTTVAQQLALALAGVRPASLLGFHIDPGERVLYLACDRPAQARRSFRRMVTEDDREALDDRLVMWCGPLPFDLATEPTALLALAKRFGCDAIILDSLKDIAADLSREESGAGLNKAMQYCVADGIDVAGLHHQRKAQAGAGKPNRLSDVYGSRWLTAGMGSVVMLWGEPGDPVIDLSHLKQPDEEVGPFSIIHDHATGTTTVLDEVDAFTLVTNAPKGITAAEVAATLYGVADRNTTVKARRQLERLRKDGFLHRDGGSRGGVGGSESARYFGVTLLRDGGA